MAEADAAKYVEDTMQAPTDEAHWLVRLLSSTELWATLIGTLIGGRLALSLAHRERQQDRLEKLLVGYEHFFEKFDGVRYGMNPMIDATKDLLRHPPGTASHGVCLARHANAMQGARGAWEEFEKAFRGMGLLEPDRRRRDLVSALWATTNDFVGALGRPELPAEKMDEFISDMITKTEDDLRLRLWAEVEALRQRLPGVPGPSRWARLRAWATRLPCRWR